MKQAFPNNHNATAHHSGAGIADYSERMNTHQANADQKREQATTRVPGELSSHTHWESPQALREWAHESELAQASFRAMLDCGAIQSRALMSAYRHACYCKAREVVARVPVIVANTLRQVSALFTIVADVMSSPPGQLTAPNVLATCHASNAPGLTPTAMTYWQVPPRE